MQRRIQRSAMNVYPWSGNCVSNAHSMKRSIFLPAQPRAMSNISLQTLDNNEKSKGRHFFKTVSNVQIEIHVPKTFPQFRQKGSTGFKKRKCWPIEIHSFMKFLHSLHCCLARLTNWSNMFECKYICLSVFLVLIFNMKGSMWWRVWVSCFVVLPCCYSSVQQIVSLVNLEESFLIIPHYAAKPSADKTIGHCAKPFPGNIAAGDLVQHVCWSQEIACQTLAGIIYPSAALKSDNKTFWDSSLSCFSESKA